LKKRIVNLIECYVDDNHGFVDQTLCRRNDKLTAASAECFSTKRRGTAKSFFIMQMKHGRLVVVEARLVSVVCGEVGQEEVPVAPCRSQLADCPFLKRLLLEMSSELVRW
jgi:hypothetical protein